jgi:hypothetical protein
VGLVEAPGVRASALSKPPRAGARQHLLSILEGASGTLDFVRAQMFN